VTDDDIETCIGCGAACTPGVSHQCAIVELTPMLPDGKYGDWSICDAEDCPYFGKRKASSCACVNDYKEPLPQHIHTQECRAKGCNISSWLWDVRDAARSQKRQ